LPPNPPISTNSAKYVETTLSKNLDMECTICFEPFNLGQVIVTIECMCVYHKTCANNWWKKKNSYTCPLHKNDWIQVSQFVGIIFICTLDCWFDQYGNGLFK